MTGLKGARIISEALGFILACLFGLSVLLPPERLLTEGSAWYSYCVICYPLILCYVAGRVFSRSSLRLAVITGCACVLVSMLAILIIMRAGGQTSSAHYILWVITAAPGALMYIIGRLCVPVYPFKFAAASVIIYLAQIAFFAAALGYTNPVSPLSVCAVANFLLCFYSANTGGLLDGLHYRADSEQTTRLPSGIMVKNAVTVTIFVLLLAIVASTGIIKGAATAIGSGLIWLLKHIPSIESSPIEPQAAEESQEVFEMTAEYVPMNPVFFTFIVAMLVFFAVGAVIAVAYMAVSSGGPGKFRRRNKYEASMDFQDEESSIFDSDKLLIRGRNALKRFGGRFIRPAGFNDMPDGKAKLRFVYRELIRSPAGEGSAAKTPLELGDELGESSLYRLTEDYTAAKYGGVEPDAESVLNAKTVLLRIKRQIRRKKK